jgi:hypothetical protein
MEAASTSETLVNFYQTTRRNNPEDSHLNTRRRENLKPDDYHYSLNSKISKATAHIVHYQINKITVDRGRSLLKFSMEMAIFWEVAPRSVAEIDRHFTSETSVNFYQTTGATSQKTVIFILAAVRT